MRLMRTKEELPILSEEISRLKASQEERLAYLKDQVAITDNLLTTHEASRPAWGVRVSGTSWSGIARTSFRTVSRLLRNNC